MAIDSKLACLGIRAIDDVLESWNALDDAHKGPQFSKATKDLEDYKQHLVEVCQS